MGRDGVELHLAAAELLTFAAARRPRWHLFHHHWELLQYVFRAWSCGPDLKGCSVFPLSFPLVIHRSAKVAGECVLPRWSAVSSRLREPRRLPELTCFCMDVSNVPFSFCQSPHWFRTRRHCLILSGWIITTGSEEGAEVTGAMMMTTKVRKHLIWTKSGDIKSVAAVTRADRNVLCYYLFNLNMSSSV